MSSDGDFDLTALEYARSHGLTIDHIREPLPLSDVMVLRNDIPKSLTDDSHLETIENPIYINLSEHITLDKGAVFLISEASGNLDSRTIECTTQSLLDVRQVRKLRFEAPLLSNDAESDSLFFGKLREQRPKYQELPMEPLDEELNEGMSWPNEMRVLPRVIIEGLQSEKLAITKDSLLFLQTQIKDNWTDEQEAKIWKALITNKMNNIFESMTPPLPSMSPIQTPYIPSSPVCHLPLLSDPSSLLSDDLRAIEGSIFEKDSLTTPIESDTIESQKSLVLIEVSNPHGTTETLECDTYLPGFARIKAEDRKVEVPLTPSKTEFAEFISPNEYIEEMLLDQHASEEDLEFFNEEFRDAAKGANRKLEQEQLHEADSKNRVHIPVMDFNLPIAPWKQIQTHETNGLRVHQKAIITGVLEAYGQIHSWPGVKKLDSTLRWTAFSSDLALVSFDGEFGGESEFNTVLGSARENEIIDSSGLTWKPLGFKILKNSDDEDDDISDGQLEKLQIEDVPTLAKKRKIKYDEEQGIRSLDKVTTEKVASFKERRQKTEHFIRNGEHENMTTSIKANGFISAKEKMEIDSNNRTSLLLGASFSASKAIDNFLELTASRRQKSIGIAYPPTASKVLENVHERHIVDSSETRSKFLPYPLIGLPSTQMPFIVSTIIFKRHSLTRALKNLIPKGEIIERDFTMHNATKWLPNSVTRSPILSPLASESDIIVSPSTGIILTNIRKISQRPLPGQKAPVEIRDRIEKVCLRYERLIVLVSEGNEEETGVAPSGADSLALAGFIGFCSSFETAVIVQFVAGGDETLAKWLVATMIRYGTQDTSVRLLQEETLWEMFLRRAGMNAFAAQAVISALKAPEGVDREVSKSEVVGLARFVEMDAEERNKRFESLLGGRRVLELVGKCLDAKWV